MQDPRVCTTLFHNRSGSPRLKRFFSFFLSICIPKSMSRYIIVSWKYIKRELTMESRQCSRCERRFLFIFLLFFFCWITHEKSEFKEDGCTRGYVFEIQEIDNRGSPLYTMRGPVHSNYSIRTTSGNHALYRASVAIKLLFFLFF